MLVPLPLCVLCVGVGGLFKGTYWKEAVVWYLSSGMSFISWISNIFVIKLYAPFVLILLGRGVGGLFKGNFWKEAVLYLSSAANNKWTSDFPSPDWDPGSRLDLRKIHKADSAGHIHKDDQMENLLPTRFGWEHESPWWYSDAKRDRLSCPS